jgi:hypothetical protein
MVSIRLFVLDGAFWKKGNTIPREHRDRPNHESWLARVFCRWLNRPMLSHLNESSLRGY